MNIEILGSVRLELSEGRDINRTSDSHYNYFFKIYFYSQSCVYDDCRELHELGWLCYCKKKKMIKEVISGYKWR